MTAFAWDHHRTAKLIQLRSELRIPGQELPTIRVFLRFGGLHRSHASAHTLLINQSAPYPSLKAIGIGLILVARPTRVRPADRHRHAA